MPSSRFLCVPVDKKKIAYGCRVMGNMPHLLNSNCKFNRDICYVVVIYVGAYICMIVDLSTIYDTEQK